MGSSQPRVPGLWVTQALTFTFLWEPWGRAPVTESPAHLIIAVLCPLSSVAVASLSSLPEWFMQLSLPLEAAAGRTYQWSQTPVCLESTDWGACSRCIVQALSPDHKSVLLLRDLGICLLNKHFRRVYLFFGSHFEECWYVPIARHL